MKLRIEFTQKEKEALSNAIIKVYPELQETESCTFKAKGKFGNLEIAETSYEVNLVEDFMLRYINIIIKALDMLKTLGELYVNLISEWFEDTEIIKEENNEESSDNEDLICPVKRINVEELYPSKMEQVAMDIICDRIDKLVLKAENYIFDSAFNKEYAELAKFVDCNHDEVLKSKFDELVSFVKVKKAEVE